MRSGSVETLRFAILRVFKPMCSQAVRRRLNEFRFPQRYLLAANWRLLRVAALKRGYILVRCELVGDGVAVSAAQRGPRGKLLSVAVQSTERKVRTVYNKWQEHVQILCTGYDSGTDSRDIGKSLGNSLENLQKGF